MLIVLVFPAIKSGHQEAVFYLIYFLKISRVHSQKSNQIRVQTEPGVCFDAPAPFLLFFSPFISAVAPQSPETLTFDRRSCDLSRLKQAPLLAVGLLSHLM